MIPDPPLALVRGGGDLATGVAARLHRCGIAVVVTEIAAPLAVRRLVALAEAVYAGHVRVEELVGRRVDGVEAVGAVLQAGEIPVLVDPKATCRHTLTPEALVDARMRKAPNELGLHAAPLVIGLGPGFTAGVDCHAVVETRRGHRLGRVYWTGRAEPDTAVPESISGRGAERVLRAPATGRLRVRLQPGVLVKAGQVVATVGKAPVTAPFDGALRGLLHDDTAVQAGDKIGDVDPRGEAGYCSEISDKSLAVGGGVLEALLSQPEFRARLGGKRAPG